MATVSIVESLIGAIPIEEGAALVARVGERATITARSGSIEVGSVALTVEAMDDLIAHVLPPDQLESLHENGTVHFEFRPPVIGGEFAVLAASTPGDRWLEIRRRNAATVAAPAPPAAVVAAPALAAVPPPIQMPAAAPIPPASAIPAADEDEVAQLLSRFQAPDSGTAGAWDPPLIAAPALSAPPSSSTVPERPFAADFDLNLLAELPAKQPSPVPPPPPAPAPAPVAREASANDDLSIPADLDLPAATSDFDLDGLSLPDTLPGPIVEGFETEAGSVESDYVPVGESRTSGTGKLSFSTSTPTRQPRRSVVMVSSVALGIVLAAGGWFAVQRYLSTPSIDVAPPPAPAPRKPVQPTAAAARTPASTATTTAATTSGAKAAAQTRVAAASKPAQPPAVATGNAATTTPKPKIAPPSAPAAAAPVVAKSATPAPAVPREGFAIQVAAVTERGEADRIVARLVNEGYSGYAIRGQGSAAAYYRVRVGAFKDRPSAEAAAARLERSEGVKPWIVKETP